LENYRLHNLPNVKAMLIQPKILPHDPANLALITSVHPGDWIIPAPTGNCNLVVIGAGTGGIACDREGVRGDDRMQTTNPRLFAAGDTWRQWWCR
jgi:hypothetical protein